MGTQDGQRPNTLQVRLDGMHAEEQRLRTFRGWPVAVIDSARIAKAGFFRTGRGAEVECFACGGRISEWNYGDVAMARHRELNPNCPFVRNPTASSNIPIAIPSSSSLSPVRQDKRENVLNETVVVPNQGGPDYRKEEVRLDSFIQRDGKRWPKQEEVSPSALAKAGFYWNPSNLYGAEEQVSDRVTCAFCESSLGGWESGDDPMSEHRRCSNTCPFVMGAPVGNVPITRSEASVVEENERLSQPRSAPGQGIGGSQFGNEKLVELVSNSKRSGAPRNQGAEILGVHPHRGPINVRYSTTESRLASFSDRSTNCWPADRVSQSPLSFAEAGFFYTGYSDRVRCFHCDLGLWEWQEDDDPWVEHARWFSNCEYVRLIKGEDFIIAAKNLRPTNESPRNTSSCTRSSSSSGTTLASEETQSLTPMLRASQPAQRVKVRNVTSEELDSLMESAPVLMALEVGLDAGRVRNILQRKVEETGVPFSSPDALVLEVLGSQTEERRNIESADESEDSEEEHGNRWGGIRRIDPEYQSDSDSDNEREIDENDSSEDDAEEGEINTDLIVNFLRDIRHPSEELQVQVDSFSTGISENESSVVEQGLDEPCTGANNITAEAENVTSSVGNRASSNPRMDSSVFASSERVEVGGNSNGVSKLASEGERTTAVGGNLAASNSASSLAALEEENRRYRESHLCKVCLDNEVGVVFLPCGHLVSCVHCAPSLKDCPVCRRSIAACVRTYLS